MSQKDEKAAGPTNAPDSVEKGLRNNYPQAKGNERYLTTTALKLLIGVLFVALQYRGYAHSKGNHHITESSRLSNGTHDYERTVILVSIDGMRCVQWYPMISQSR